MAVKYNVIRYASKVEIESASGNPSLFIFVLRRLSLSDARKEAGRLSRETGVEHFTCKD